MSEITALWSLFASAFLAATILPAQSELLLASLTASGKYSVVLLLVCATAGNVIGSMLNYCIGKYLIRFKDHKYFPIKKNLLKKATTHYNKYGAWTLLLAWMPIIGDAFTVIAGIFKTNFLLFLILVTIGKSIRYILIIMFVI
ncbi:MAG: DedA family protein [Proteobacteria bacterium]|nr:DedA family protein [Pseudomonadota bacterium]